MLHFPEHGLTVDARGGEHLSIRRGDPLSARGDTGWTIVHERGEWKARADTRMTLTSDEDAFRLTAHVEAFEGAERIHRRDWDYVSDPARWLVIGAASGIPSRLAPART